MQNTLAALLRVANARYSAFLACKASRTGHLCSAAGELGRRPQAGCTLAVPAGTTGDDAVRSTLVQLPASATGMCSATCSAGLEAYFYEAGCCTATAAAAQAEWFAAVSSNAGLGSHFRVQWSDGRSSTEEFRLPAQCTVAGWNGASVPVPAVGADCAAAACGLEWPMACCSALACANGGVKEHPYACHCSCPASWTGSTCADRAAHARLSLAIAGLSRQMFETRCRSAVLSNIAATAGAGVSLELDLVAELLPTAASVRFSVASAERSGKAEPELRVDVRVLVGGGGGDRALRAAVKVEQAVADGLLGAAVLGAGAGTSMRSLRVAEAYDDAGRQVCDPILLRCTGAEPVATPSPDSSSSSTAGRPAMLAVGLGAGFASAAIIAAIAVCWCRRNHCLCFTKPEDCSSAGSGENSLPQSKRRSKTHRQCLGCGDSGSGVQARFRPKPILPPLVFDTARADPHFVPASPNDNDTPTVQVKFRPWNGSRSCLLPSARGIRAELTRRSGGQASIVNIKQPTIQGPIEPFWQVYQLQTNKWSTDEAVTVSAVFSSSSSSQCVPQLLDAGEGKDAATFGRRASVMRGFTAAAAAAGAASPSMANRQSECPPIALSLLHENDETPASQHTNKPAFVTHN